MATPIKFYRHTVGPAEFLLKGTEGSIAFLDNSGIFIHDNTKLTPFVSYRNNKLNIANNNVQNLVFQSDTLQDHSINYTQVTDEGIKFYIHYNDGNTDAGGTIDVLLNETDSIIDSTSTILPVIRFSDNNTGSELKVYSDGSSLSIKPQGSYAWKFDAHELTNPSGDPVATQAGIVVRQTSSLHSPTNSYETNIVFLIAFRDLSTAKMSERSNMVSGTSIVTIPWTNCESNQIYNMEGHTYACGSTTMICDSSYQMLQAAPVLKYSTTSAGIMFEGVVWVPATASAVNSNQGPSTTVTVPSTSTTQIYPLRISG